MQEKVKEILAQIKEDPDIASTLSNNADILNDVGLDSIQIINFMLKIEEEFDVEIDYDNFNYNHMTSIDKLCQFLSQQKPLTEDNW
ncbi:MAG: phosphopantetheine-binding protein [Desulfobacterales bacterium]